MKTTSRVLAPVAALVLAGGLAACGGSADGEAAPAAVDTAAPFYAQLPQEIKEAGAVQVGTDAAYAPMEYFDTDGKTIIGFDKDLGDLLGEKLGVPFVFNNATFDGLITQINSDRFDVAITAMTDTPERQQEVDFVDYFMSGSVMIVQTGNPNNLQSVQDLCGKTIALQRGTMLRHHQNHHPAARFLQLRQEGVDLVKQQLSAWLPRGRFRAAQVARAVVQRDQIVEGGAARIAALAAVIQPALHHLGIVKHRRAVERGQFRRNARLGHQRSLNIA